MVDLRKMKRLRLALGLTMDQAAQKAGFYGRQRWYELESGRRGMGIKTLEKVAKALGVKAAELLK